MPVFWILFGLFAIFVTGVGLLVWLAPVQETELTPAQASLTTISDWLIKISAGAFVGFVGGVGLSPHRDRRR